jgi:hypothetical protein
MERIVPQLRDYITTNASSLALEAIGELSHHTAAAIAKARDELALCEAQMQKAVTELFAATL